MDIDIGFKDWNRRKGWQDRDEKWSRMKIFAIQWRSVTEESLTKVVRP